MYTCMIISCIFLFLFFVNVFLEDVYFSDNVNVYLENDIKIHTEEPAECRPATHLPPGPQTPVCVCV
jgi:hypothetical protein